MCFSTLDSHTEYKDNKLSDSIEVCCSFTAFNLPRIVDMLNNEKNTIFSLDSPENAFLGSAVDGICMKLWTTEPYLLPKNTYRNNPKSPILTISSKAVLLSREDIKDEIIYDIIECLLANKSDLVNETPVIIPMSEQFNPNSLLFPLHSGVRRYLSRNAPNYIEKHAELLALIISLIVVSAGVFTTIIKWRKQLKKDRIDVYYAQVLEIDDKLKISNSRNDLNILLSELYNLRNKAFDNLIKENLTANESFSIFLNLLEKTIELVNKKLIINHK